MKLKKVILATSVLMLIAGIAGCGGKKNEEAADNKAVVQSETKETKEAEPQQEESASTLKGEPVKDNEKVPENENLLTGVADLTDGAVGKRPVAVMVNNVEAAMPQYGVAEADIIFEIPVEGDKTRFMAMYGDYTQVPQICSVRSCRAYFPAFSQGFDAFYVNWGIDDSMEDYLDALNMDQIEGITNTGGLFGRDQDRLNSGYALEHTGYFDGTRLVSYLESEGIRTDLAEDKTGPAFSFNGMEEQVKPAGSDCTTVNIDFGSQTAQFTYDAEKKVYLKKMNQNPQIDGKTGTQLAFTNVFVLETDISVRDDIGHKDVNWEGGENYTGYYVSNGGVQKIHWAKEPNNENSYLKFYDESGNELKINRGKSYIAVNYKNQAEFK